MKRFIEGEDRSQSVLFPERLDDYIGDDNPVRAIDAFVEELDLAGARLRGRARRGDGRPAYHPAALLRIYIYGYMTRVQSSRCMERETQRNVELIWLTGRLSPDFKTIADFRKDKGLPMMEQGIQKGQLKALDQSKLHLGYAYYLAGDKAKAQTALKNVGGKDGSADFAKLWSIIAAKG